MLVLPVVEIDLVIPGLLGPLPGGFDTRPPCPALPGLDRFLSRSEPSSVPGNFETLLLLIAGLPLSAGVDCPWGAVRRFGEGASADGRWWMCADPVHLRPDGDRLLLFGGARLEVTEADARGLTAALNEAYAPDEILFEAPHPGRWYVTGRPQAVLTSPLGEVDGRSIEPFLPTGPDGPLWRRRLNEIQMIFHRSEINQRRRERGLVDINSVWFWGGGPLPVAAHGRFAGILGDDRLTRGVSRLCGCEPAPAPAGVAEWLEGLSGSGRYLIVLRAAAQALAEVDQHTWQAALAEIDRCWLAPLFGAVKSGRVARVTVYAGEGTGYRLDRKGARRFWRRSRASRFIHSGKRTPV